MAEKGFYEKIEKIEQVSKVGSPAPALDVAAAEEIEAPTKIKFDNAVAKAETRWNHSQQIAAVTAEAPTGPSPLEEMSQAQRKLEVPKVAPTVDQVLNQGNDLRSSVQTNTTTIHNNPDLKVKASQEAALTSRLIHVDSGLRAASSGLGIEVTAKDFATPAPQKPLVKFLNMLSSSDRQLTTIIGQLSGLQAQKELLTPDKLLAVQIKLNFVDRKSVV